MLVLRENIYTDSAETDSRSSRGCTRSTTRSPKDPVMVTTNFSITYFSVANEIEGAGLPAGCWSPTPRG